MSKKTEQIIYQSNSKGTLYDIKINLNVHTIKSPSPYMDLKALKSADIGRKSSMLSQNPKPNNVSHVLNYLNKYVEYDKQKWLDTKEFLNESSLTTFKTGLNNGNMSANTSINNNNPIKSRVAPTENNEAFKYLKNRLADKHYESISRPNFNVAGIIPNPKAEKHAKDFYDIKFAKSGFAKYTSVSPNVSPSTRVHFNQVKNEVKKRSHPIHSTPQQQYLQATENVSPLSTYHENFPKKILKSRNEPPPSSPVSSPVSNIPFEYVREAISRKELNRSELQNRTNEPSAFSIKHETQNDYYEENNAETETSHQKSIQEQINSIYLTLPSILPNTARIYDTDYSGETSRPNFSISYKQSGLRPQDLNLRVNSYGKELKINNNPPKKWLKSKYLSNIKNESGLVNYARINSIRSNAGMLASARA